jgi:uncharacterized protein (TIGR00725 family)
MLNNVEKPNIIIGVMGPGEKASNEEIHLAYQLGKQIAREGWITLSGGRNVGVMDAVCRGAKENKGLTIGILPGENLIGASQALDIPIVTGMGNARNIINVLTAHVIVVCGMGPGTASEVAMAIKGGKEVVLMGASEVAESFFNEITKNDDILTAQYPDEAIRLIKRVLELNYV